ncbi:DNA polymerase III subunit epsilon [Corynebacterium capitovis DSM 44611]|uniref:exonuclease domain-containing protein n=1 Tax=Corynebacterium capitovis TaxID=131081 RepID=UPI0003634846|nr:exonuclease domain-containing protein [Corynebacterium capitovis]WKD57789.1 DNA polymerase III subunit epsilon [Corynebacterium capitovis DSM 44611]
MAPAWWRREEADNDALLAVDVETTGLTPGRDHLVSVGWVPVNRKVIDLSQARHYLILGARVGNSATLHGVTDDDIAREGVPAAAVLDAFDQAFRGRRLLAHFAQMELSFLNYESKRVRGTSIRMPARDVVDTFALERRHMERMGTYPRGEDLRLARVRQRYHLPTYRSHNALTDAIACAELYLALTSR